MRRGPACALAGGLWTWLAGRLFTGMWQNSTRARMRFVYIAGAGLLVGVLSQTVSLRGAKVSQDRTINEIANNGTISLIGAAWTRHLGYT